MPKSANKNIGEEIGDWYPVFYNAFDQYTQSAETLKNAVRHTDQERRFVIKEQNQSAISFLLSMAGSRRIFFITLYYYRTSIMQISGVWKLFTAFFSLSWNVKMKCYMHMRECDFFFKPGFQLSDQNIYNDAFWINKNV